MHGNQLNPASSMAQNMTEAPSIFLLESPSSNLVGLSLPHKVVACRICQHAFAREGVKALKLLCCGHTICHACHTKLPLWENNMIRKFDRQPTGESGVRESKLEFLVKALVESENLSLSSSGESKIIKKVDPEEFKILIGDIESSPIFPESGEVHRCAVMNGRSPDWFWIHPIDENTIKLRTTMNTVLEQLYSPLLQREGEDDSEIKRFRMLRNMFRQLSDSNEGSDRILKEIIDEYLALLGDYGVLFLPNEETFHRVEIMPSTGYESDQKIALYLIDEGRFSIAHFKFIWPMSKKLVEYPRFAMCCYLDGVSPHGKVDQQAPVMEWPERLLIKLEDLFAENAEWNVQFKERSARMPQGRFSVTLSKLNLNEVLYDFGKSRKSLCVPR